VLKLSQSPLVASDELVGRLTELQLCRPADFRRARAGVRRLAHDLPAFDSVWIDALVQLRRLTPYQAHILDVGQAEQLRLGPYVIVDKLGHGPHGTTFLAEFPGRREQCVLKRLEIAIESIPDCRARLQKLQEQTEGWSHPHVVVPRLLDTEVEQGITVVSRYVPGLTLADLLVRRGRFPFPIVVDIARQLASGLAALHGRGLSHGEIRLANVRLTTGGSVVLVDAGIRPAVCSELTIHDSLALDAYDGTAPELIGTGAAPNASSEIYSVGCLLWQLLTGRPPYPMADPLMKLAAHQTQRIADVRTWAPDTSLNVAEAIFAMTSPIPNERPCSFDDLLRRWGRPGIASRSRLKRYRKGFDGAVPHFAQPADGIVQRRWPWIAVCLFIVAGSALTFADRGMKNELLSIKQCVFDTIQLLQSHSPSTVAALTPVESGEGANSEHRENGLLPLPSRSPDGEIILAEAGPYDVDVVEFRQGQLTIRGATGVNPIIRIGHKPLRLAAETVSLINVTVECEDPRPAEPVIAKLYVRSQRLLIQDCVFQRSTGNPDVASPECPVVAWSSMMQALRPTAAEERRIDVENTVWRFNGPAFWFGEVPSVVRISNCLKLGDGACFAISHKAVAHPIQFDLSRLTLRNSGPLLCVSGELAEQADAPAIKVAANDCVFKVASPDQGLFEFQAAEPRSHLERAIQMSGQGSIIPEGLNMIVTVNPDLSTASIAVAEANEQEQYACLMTSELADRDFDGPVEGSAKNSRLIRSSAPRSSRENSYPGVDTSKLPRHAR